MALVKIYTENNTESSQTLSAFSEIKAKLAEINIGVEEWHPKNPLSANPSQEEVLEAYADQVSRIMQTHNFKGVDVVSVAPAIDTESHNKISVMRQKFLDEHIHADDEVRYFIEGQGLFCVHAAGKIYQILCTRGDFISVPAKTQHWFDMGTEPYFKCIRFFAEESGWIAEYTGNPIAKSFPDLDKFLGGIYAH